MRTKKKQALKIIRFQRHLPLTLKFHFDVRLTTALAQAWGRGGAMSAPHIPSDKASGSAGSGLPPQRPAGSRQPNGRRSVSSLRMKRFIGGLVKKLSRPRYTRNVELIKAARSAPRSSRSSLPMLSKRYATSSARWTQTLASSPTSTTSTLSSPRRPRARRSHRSSGPSPPSAFRSTRVNASGGAARQPWCRLACRRQ